MVENLVAFATIISERIECARQYFDALERSFRLGWRECYSGYKAKELPWHEAMALVHPRHYEDHVSCQVVQGARSFPRELVQRSAKCDALRFWGYECNVRAEKDVTSDHVFPYSLGGPTVSTNKRFLCGVHNLMKGGDVHLFPWEEGEPEWLDQLVKTIGRWTASN